MTALLPIEVTEIFKQQPDLAFMVQQGLLDNDIGPFKSAIAAAKRRAQTAVRAINRVVYFQLQQQQGTTFVRLNFDRRRVFAFIPF